jgi:hypothetical protein
MGDESEKILEMRIVWMAEMERGEACKLRQE